MSERIYKDTNGMERTLHGMLIDEPEWLLSRFRFMEKKNEELEKKIRTLEAENKRLKKLEDNINILRNSKTHNIFKPFPGQEVSSE